MKERPSFSVAATHDRSSDISPLSVDFSLQELLRKLRRRKWLILAFVAGATLLTAVVSLLLTSRYTATAPGFGRGSPEHGTGLRGTGARLADGYGSHE